MVEALPRILSRFARANSPPRPSPPLLVELFGRASESVRPNYESYPFGYSVAENHFGRTYSISLRLNDGLVGRLRDSVVRVSERLDPSDVEPLTFKRLIEVLSQLAAKDVIGLGTPVQSERLAELVAYEAVGMSRILALAMDRLVTEFYVDSDQTCVYLDHSSAGRCNSQILLTDRERKAIETHMDTFRGYSLDYETPSLKNDLDVGSSRLRVSLDLEPVSVNRFSLDVRRLDVTSLSLSELVGGKVLSGEAAAFLVKWLERGGNVTIVGETGTGKTTLLNAIDEQLDPRLRRVYIEDAVETREMLHRGYHQLKLKVDPFEKGGGATTGKEAEIIKVLHRSPDLVILSEIQSEEHSRAFFHALSAGVRGIQTFHASTVEQAVRRWTNLHGVPVDNLLDLGTIVQMVRPQRLGPSRIVARVCQVVNEGGLPRIRELYRRDREGGLTRVVEWERVVAPGQLSQSDFGEEVEAKVKALFGK